VSAGGPDGPAGSAGGGVDAQVRVFVQTRGAARATDYAFLGGAPPEPWWRAYRDVTAFDHPTVLVTSDGARFRAYLSGIPSARVDAVGTVVRYTLVLDGPCGAADAACASAAVAAWVDDVADGGHRLSTALDARFPPDDVQRWLAGTTGPAGSVGPAGSEVRRRALAALAALPAPGGANTGAADVPGDWIGGVGAPAARAAFAARVAALVGGVRGRALLLNLVGPDDAAALVDDDGPVAVLVEGADARQGRPTALRPVVEAKKAPPAAERAATAQPAAERAATGTASAALAVLLAAVVLVVTVLVLLL
jgi:hypothetical protein